MKIQLVQLDPNSYDWYGDMRFQFKLWDDRALGKGFVNIGRME